MLHQSLEAGEKANLITAESINTTVTMNDDPDTRVVKPQDNTCYTYKTGCQPVRALCREVNESMQEQREYNAAQGDNGYCSEIQIANCTGSVIGFAGAMAMTLFSVPYGLYRDGRRIVTNLRQNSAADESVEVAEAATSAPVITNKI